MKTFSFLFLIICCFSFSRGEASFQENDPFAHEGEGEISDKAPDGYTEDEDDFEDEPLDNRPLGQPSRRQGFQQTKNMSSPERLAPMPRSEEESSHRPLERSEAGAVDSEPVPLRESREIKFGQTEWNQIDLHSLVRDRSY
jgi:hypothetical protein